MFSLGMNSHSTKFCSNLLDQFFNLGFGSLQTDTDLFDIYALIDKKSILTTASDENLITYIIFIQLVFICTHLTLNLCLPHVQVEMVRDF